MYGGKFAFQKLVMARKFTIFPLFYFVLEGKFQVQPPRGGLYSEGRFNRNIIAGAHFRNFTVFSNRGRLRTSQFFLCDKQHESRRVREKKPKFKKSSSLVLIGQTIYSHSKTRKFILKQCRQCVQQSINLLINFQVFK